MEKVLCAAIWYKDLPSQGIMFQPINVNKGIVLCGWRHGSIIQQLFYTTGKRTVQFGKDAVGDFTQGFLTSANRFVDRKEARDIFVNCGGTPEWGDQLFSEDLY